MENHFDTLAAKGFRIAIFPQRNFRKWLWSCGVYIGDSTKAEWVDKKNDLPRACYLTYEEALSAALDYVEHYKPKKTKKTSKV